MDYLADAHAGNDPINRNDPSGKVAPLVTGAIGAGGAALAAWYGGGSPEQIALAAGAGFLVGSGLALVFAPELAAAGVRAGASMLGAEISAGTAALTGNLAVGGLAAVSADALVQTGEMAFNADQSFDVSRSGVAVTGGVLGAALPATAAYGSATALAEAGLSTSSFLAQGLAVTLPEQLIFESVSTATAIGLGELFSDDTPDYSGAPDSFNPTLNLPSTDVSDALRNIYCSPKCY